MNIGTKLLTDKQREWLYRKNIKIDGFYMFPRFGFTIYKSPTFSSGKRMDTNPFTKSLDHEYFLVKDKSNGFVKGNFSEKPDDVDFYLREDELADRAAFETLFLLIVAFVPMLIWNKLSIVKIKH